MKTLTNNVSDLTELNKFNPNYIPYSGASLDTEAIQLDFDLLREYTKRYESRYSLQPSLGDSLRLPDGQIVYFCHIYNDSVQTCASGSFHLSESGFISYSGGLDPGISFNDIKLTNEKYTLPIWFCHKGYLTGGCAIYAHIECRVWKTKESADLSGIPQVELLRRQKLKEQSETITKVDGNGREYKEHLPEIIIHKKDLPEELLEEIEHITGLKFEESYYFVPVYRCQPMKLKQIALIKNFVQLDFTERRDSYQPLLVGKINK